MEQLRPSLPKFSTNLTIVSAYASSGTRFRGQPVTVRLSPSSRNTIRVHSGTASGITFTFLRISQWIQDVRIACDYKWWRRGESGWNPVLSRRKLLILQSDKSAKYAGFATSSYVEFTRDLRQIAHLLFAGDTFEQIIRGPASSVTEGSMRPCRAEADSARDRAGAEGRGSPTRNP